MVGSGYCTPDTSVEIEMVIFIGCKHVPPLLLLLVVGARGPRVVIIDGRLTKKEITGMGSLTHHILLLCFHTDTKLNYQTKETHCI